MCIRDSSKTTSYAYVNFDDERLLKVTNYDDIIDAVKRVYGCLLYTSDAADERSSVDLGGRRIIKKKNTHESFGAAIMVS
mgnify:CR=1 FL=1